MLLDKQYYDSYSQASPLVTKYMDLCFSHSLHQLIAEPTRTTDRTKTPIDHILTNSAEKVIQSGVIEMVLSDHGLIYCTRKTSLLKLNEHCKISIRSMKKYSNEIFVEQLTGKQFLDYSNYTCVNDSYQDFVTKFFSIIDFVAPITTLRVKSNTKPWFDIDGLNTIWKRDKHYRKFKRSGKEIDKGNLKCEKLLLKKVINNKKKLYFEVKIAENRNNVRELWRTLKSLGMPSKGGMQSKISFKGNGVVSFNSQDNINTFCRFFSKLTDSLLQKLPPPKNKFGIKITEEAYSKWMWGFCSVQCRCNNSYIRF